MSNSIVINGGLKYEVPNGVMPDIMDLVTPHETEESKENRRKQGTPNWIGKENYLEAIPHFGPTLGVK